MRALTRGTAWTEDLSCQHIADFSGFSFALRGCSAVSEIGLSQRVVRDPRFRRLVQAWVAEGLPREWLVAQCRQLAMVMAQEAASSSRGTMS